LNVQKLGFCLLTFILQLVIYLYIILFSSLIHDFGFIFMLLTPVNGALSLDLMVFNPADDQEKSSVAYCSYKKHNC